MIKFNLREVLRANNTPAKLMSTLYNLAYTSKVSKGTMSFSRGPTTSFMTGLGKLIGSTATIEQRYEYFVLAGKRNLADYSMLGITYLDLELWPDIDISVLNRNPLLKVTGLRVYFTLEETEENI